MNSLARTAFFCALILTGHASPAPVNDRFASRTGITGALPVLLTSDNLGATVEEGEPDTDDTASSVWYTWTAPSSGSFELSIPHADFDSELHLYTGGTLETLIPVGSGWGTKFFTATAGNAYQIRVTGYYGDDGLFQIALRNQVPPANDHFANRVSITGLPGFAVGSGRDATSESGEPASITLTGRSTWYTWTAPSTATVDLSLITWNSSSPVHVLTGGTLSTLVPVVSGYGSVRLNATAGTVYQIAVCTEPGDSGEFQINLQRSLGNPNDLFASRATLSPTLPLEITGSMIDAEYQAGEPGDEWDQPPAVWYKWTPGFSGEVQLYTRSDDEEPRLSIFTGSALGSLTEVATGYSRIVLNVVAGTEYQIAVSGYESDSQLFTLGLRRTLSPVNDLFANAIAITGTLPVVASGTTTDATHEELEPDQPGDDSGSVWYTWTAPATANHEFIITGDNQYLDIYTGTSIGNLTLVKRGYGSTRLPTVAGTSYKIAVRGDPARLPSFELVIRTMVPPSNDNYSARITIGSAVPVTVTGTNVDATTEAGEPDPWEEGMDSSVWYTWTAATAGTYEIAFKEDEQDNVMFVFSGTAFNSLSDVGQNYHRVIFDATAGETFPISILGEEGPFEFTIRRIQAPANDAFANREVIPAGLPAVVSGHNYKATVEAQEPDLSWDESSVWYSWTAPSSGIFSLDVLSDNYGESATVYTGNSLGTLQWVSDSSQFTAVVGTTYQIAVEGDPSYPSTFRLVLARYAAPGNDNFANRTAITGSLPLKFIATTDLSTTETGEPSIFNEPAGSIWYSWTAPSTGAVKLSTRTEDGGHYLHVVTGTTFPSMVTVAQGQGTTAFRATAGTTYQIAILAGRFAGNLVQFEMTSVPAPANDAFANRIALPAGSNSWVEGQNIGATLQTGEPNPLSGGGASVWYSWKAPASGSFEIIENRRDIPVVIGIYTGTAVNALTAVGQGRNNASFTAVGGTTYAIALHGASGTMGDFRLAFRQIHRPANDLFVNRVAMPNGFYTSITGDNTGATLQTGEPDPGQDGNSSVWYSWTATASGLAEFATESYNSQLLYVFTGTSLDGLTVQGQGYGRAQFTAVSGTTYHVAVHSGPYDQGRFHLSVKGISRPGNDSFANRTTIAASATSVGGTTVGATLQSGEPLSPDGGSTSVWYSWTPSSTGAIEFSIAGDRYSPAGFSVFTGTSVTGLTRIGNSDYRMTFQAVAGTTYQIAVYGYASAPDFFNLRIRKPSSPANDNFANRIALTGPLPLKITSHNFDATIETSEPDPSEDGGRSVWYSWTAPTTGIFEVGITRGDFYSRIYAFTGTSLANLQLSASGNNRVTISATAGTTYQIAIHGEYGEQGLFQAGIAEIIPPDNDHFANRITIAPGNPATISGTNIGATLETNEPDSFGEGGKSVWYQWTPETSGDYEITFSEWDFGTLLYVYTGTSLASLQEVGSDYRSVKLAATAGTTYLIAVHGEYGDEGEFELRISKTPDNDDFADRITIPPGLPVAITSTNIGATLETDEPGDSGRSSIWYSWTAPRNGTFRIDTYGSDFDTVLYAYTGTILMDLLVIAENDDSQGVASAVEIAATAGTTYQIAVRGYGSDAGTVKLNISSTGTGFDSWAGNYGLDGADAEPGATPRGDGVSNLLKYAFGMDPYISAAGPDRYLAPGAGSSGLPSILRKNGYLVIEYVRRTDSSDLNYIPQFSSTLSGTSGWDSTSGVLQVIEDLGSGWERVTYTDTVPASAKRFGRVKVEIE